MNKEGHIGVANDVNEPIKKLEIGAFKSKLNGISLDSFSGNFNNAQG
jgi:hypothetical protein